MSTESTTEEIEQNVTFADAEAETSLTIGNMSSDPTYYQGSQDNADLGAFLSRPVLIHSIVWPVNVDAAFYDVINPWQLFLNDARVKSKLETFKLLHGCLKIKILINGSPYHYGRTFVGVRPTRFDNNTSVIDINSPTVSKVYFDNAIAGFKTSFAARTLYTQRDHVFIDPATNQPNHISWPFFASTNYLDLTKPESIDRLGVLEIWPLNTLRHNNDALDPLTINFFAWMEETELTGLTAAPVAVAQSSMGNSTKQKSKRSKGKDEYASDGVISAPATAVANYVSYFTRVPYISKFAKATVISAGALADVARIFGYSRPPQIENVVIQRPQTLGSFAYTSSGDPLQKLTLDPKQELTIDPSTVGLMADDQMAIGYIAKKEAYIDGFTWSSNVAADRLLYSILVHPMVAPVDNVDRYWQTPLSFVTLPFNQWTGTLRYRFQIVASAFHRGRLAVVYEPSTATTAQLDYNSRYLTILDLAEAKDFTIEVAWSQPQAYCQVALPDNVRWTSTGQPAVLVDNAFTNGSLSVYVINELASSITNTEIDINVYISAGDNYQVQMPRERLSRVAYARNDIPVGPPAIAQSEVITQGENMPEQETHYIVNKTYCKTDPNQDLVYFGEQIVSTRSLLKRYCFHRTLAVDDLNAGDVYLKNFWQFNVPVGPGPDYGSSLASPITPIAAGPYNICAMTYIRYFMQAYIGYRGGIKWKAINVKGQGSAGLVKVGRTSARINIEDVSTTIVRGTGTTVLNTAKRYLAFNPNSTALEGAYVNSALVNPTVEYEVPFYAPYRYGETNEPPLVDAVRYQSMYNGGGHYLTTVSRNSDADTLGYIETYCSTGEDFSLFYFIGAPPYYNTDTNSIV